VGPNVREAVRRLEAAGGGYEVIHESPGLELGVYVLLAPTPDTQTPHAFDEVYVVLAGAGEIEIDGCPQAYRGRRPGLRTRRRRAPVP
jgi:mannose-6-phosphate isomerase-like protein (cupin superfamily)